MKHAWFLSCLVALGFFLSACATQAARAPITGREQVLAGASEQEARAEADKLWRRAMAALAAEPRCNPSNHPSLRGCLFVSGDYKDAAQAAIDRFMPVIASVRPDLPLATPGWRFEVAILNDTERNAFALAGGKVFIMRGLIDDLKLTRNELAAIIAHEFAHALAQHQREAQHARLSGELAGAFPRAIVIALIGVDPKPLTDAAFVLPHSREQEAEADAIALRLLARAGYDPRVLVRVLDKLATVGESGGKGPEWLSTHPDPQTRRDLAERLIREDAELMMAAVETRQRLR